MTMYSLVTLLNCVECEKEGEWSIGRTYKEAVLFQHLLGENGHGWPPGSDWCPDPHKNAEGQ